MTPTRILTVVRVLSVLATAIVFAGAVVLSYSGLRDLALAANIDPQLALLVPLVVDGLIVSGSLLAIANLLTDQSPRFAWLLVIVGSASTLWGNIALATTAQEVAVHAVAPIALILSMESALLSFKREAQVKLDTAKADAEAAERAEKLAARKAAQAAPRRAPAANPRARSASTKRLGSIPPEKLAEAEALYRSGTSMTKVAEKYDEFYGLSWWKNHLGQLEPTVHAA